MSFPPVKTLATIPVSQEIALKFLSTFLAASKSTPYMLPGARLEPSGPAAGSSSSPMVQNLQRVEAGLRGEWLAPVLDLQNDEEERWMKVGGGLRQEGESDNIELEGWQDLDEYQREQSIEEGEVRPRHSGVAQEGDDDFEERMEVEVEGEAEVEEEAAPKAKKGKTKREGGLNGKSSKPMDKGAKKKAKKERIKEEKKKRRAEELKRKGTEE
jgi:hypothetical protein